jgi:phage/plasmid primase-like uncharacterized protein
MIADKKDPGALAGAFGVQTTHKSRQFRNPVRAFPKDDLAALKARLEDRLEELLAMICKGPSERRGREMRFGRRGSLALEVAGADRGRWFDFETGTGGDVLALIRHRRRCDFQAALAFAKSFLGLPVTGTVPPLTRAAIQRRDEAKDRAREDDRRPHLAYRAWRAAQPLAGTLAETYLRSRGIKLSSLPTTLRFEPEAIFTVKDGVKVRHPAMVAAVSLWGTKTACAVQRTALQPDGKGKADLPGGSRRTFGPARGGAVRLSRFEPGRTLVLAEGVETALACLQAMPDAAVWATLGTSGLRSVLVPAGSRVLIAADADDAGRKAAADLAQRLTRDGHAVSVATPPKPGADFNDLLREVAP